jgi:hypothetical protein
MKIKKGFMVRKIVDLWIVVPLGERVVDFNGILTLSDSAARLWNRLEAGSATRDELLAELTDTYDVDAETAAADLDAFFESLTVAGLIES